jgi:hypothetical protein
MINETSRHPYLSVVVTTRNDDHGGDPLKRLQAFVNCFDAQARTAGLDAEVIVVEWNPPEDKPRVSSLVRLPEPAYCEYRFIDVPAALHAAMKYADVLPLFQMAAKNVGIRRARGRFVLATNIDIIFSNELVESIASGRLQPGCLYRVDRHDIQPDFPVNAPLDAQMEYCRVHQLRLHTGRGSYPVDAHGRLLCVPDDIADGRAVRLGSGWHVREGGDGPPFRWATRRAQLIVDPRAAGMSLPAILEIDIRSNCNYEGSWADVIVVDGAQRVEGRRIHGLGRVAVRLDASPTEGEGERRIELVVADTDPASRRHLPLSERRSELEYTVHAVRLRAAPATPPQERRELPLAGWTNAYPDSDATLTPTLQGLAVTTARRRMSYCARYGPLRPTRSRRYRFELGVAMLEGDISFGVLSANGRHWIPSVVDVSQDATSRWFVIDVHLYAGHPYWLVLSNNHPLGDGRSAVVVHRLTGPAAIEAAGDGARSWTSRLLSSRLAEWAAVMYARVALGVSATLPMLQWPRAIASALRRILTNAIQAALPAPVRQSVVDAAPETAALRQKVEAMTGQLRQLDYLSEVGAFLRDRRLKDLHVNACGDFQLMAREHWELLRGYPEFETFSMNIDAMLSYMAAAAGLTERVLDAPIYHLEHEIGSGWSPEGEALLRRRIAERGITWIDATTVHLWAAYMDWLGRPMIVNGPDWGLANHALTERTNARIDATA